MLREVSEGDFELRAASAVTDNGAGAAIPTVEDTEFQTPRIIVLESFLACIARAVTMREMTVGCGGLRLLFTSFSARLD